MKRTLVTALVGLAAVVTVHAQGSIILYNYNTGHLITYGTGAGNPIGQPVVGGFSVGFYWATGDVTSFVNSAMNGDGGYGFIPTLALFTGAHGTATIGTDLPGYFSDQTASANLGVAGGSTVTLVVVAYNGATYDTSFLRGHSTAFTMTAQASPNPPDIVGNFMPGFSIPAIPEPSMFALTGLGLAGLWFFRRRPVE